MSQIRRNLIIVLPLCLALLSLAGCGDNNTQTNFDPDSGAHPAGWLPTGHAANVQAHGDTGCTDCHGADFFGGTSKVSCTQVGCHLGSHVRIHPLDWYAQGDTTPQGQLAYALHGPFVKERNDDPASCNSVFCHGANLEGATGPSCTSCHLGGPFHVHPLDWATPAQDFAATPPLHAQYVATRGTPACSNATCHGTTLRGVFLSGPSCNECHPF